MRLIHKWTLAIRCPLVVLASLAWPLPYANGGDDLFEVADFVTSAKHSLASAVFASQAECKDGIPFKAAISRQRPTHAFEVLLLTGDGKVIRVEIDAICSEVLASEEEPTKPAEVRELRRTVRRARVRLAEAIDAAAKRTKGVAVRGELRAGEQKVTAAIGLLLHGVDTEIEIDRVIKDADRNHELLVSKEIDSITLQ